MIESTRGRSRRTWSLRRRLISLFAGALLGATTLSAVPASPAAAITGSEFMPGLIISDALFYDSAAMSEADIQIFLASRGSALAGYTFTVASRGAVYSERTGNLVCSPFTGGTLSAATIIYRAQVACNISAKVILVTLQKEQGLITKSSPSQAALDRAMGYACPDTAPCAPTTLGFGNQVYAGAQQLNTYKQGRFARQPGTHAIQFHPNAGCGSSSVYVQNYATAALYNYTPYQPNAAALANLGGTGDSCSSYGNRNFWYFYTSWFGSTLGNSPYPIALPGIVGNATVGTALTAKPGIWAGSPSFTYSWLACDSRPDAFVDTVPTGCSALPGAVTDTYVSTTADLGKYIAVMVRGANASAGMTSGAVMSARIGTPVNTAQPAVSGTSTVGATWTVDVGSWTGTPSPTLGIFWLRCSQALPSGFTAVPSGCSAIAGANSSTYVTTADDLGKYLTAQVAGSNTLGFSLAGAPTTAPLGFPVNVSAPTVDGSAMLGSTWTADVGSWDGTPDPSFGIFWLRCSQPIVAAFTAVPAGCSAIPGARSATYVTGPQDLGKYVTVQIAGSNSLGFALAGAVSGTMMQAAVPANVTAPTVNGSSTIGGTWTVDPGTWTGAPAPSLSIFWLRCRQPVTAVFTAVPPGCTAISGATGTSYRSSAEDSGKFITAQVAGTNSQGFALAGAISTTPVDGGLAVPTNTVPPTVTGSPAVGADFTASTGTWSGASTLSIFWLRCMQPVATTFAAVPSGCTAIAGANASTYTVTALDTGKYVTAQVAGSNAAGFSLAGAVSTTPIQGAVAAPTNSVLPSVSGDAIVGSTLEVDRGTWSGSPTFGIFWLRCDRPIVDPFTAVPQGCTAIRGANASSYIPVSHDVGTYLTVQIAATNGAGFTLAGSLSTGAVQAGPGLPVNTAIPTVSGPGAVGSTLSADVGTWTGSPTFGIFWLRCNQPIVATFTAVPSGCTAISGANSPTYVLKSGDLGKYVTVQVAGTNATGFTLAGATATAPVGT